MNHAKDCCLKNRIKSAMEKGEHAQSLTVAVAGHVNLGDQADSAEPKCEQALAPPAPVSPDEDEAGNARIFPQRLYDILSNERNSTCIGWLPHGRGFIIKNRKRFAAEVLPRYFKQTKYTSFTRKLNRWDFTRVTRGPELGAYYHKFFRRGEPTLCTQMYCKNERAKFAAKQQQQQVTDAAPATAAATERVAAEQQPLQRQPVVPPAVELELEPVPIAEPQKVATPAHEQQPATVPALPKIHPSLLMSPRAKMLLATHIANQAHIPPAFNFTQARQQQQQEQEDQKQPAASTNAIVDAAVQAMYRSNSVQPPSEFCIAALQRQQAAIATQMAQARATLHRQRQQFAAQQQQQQTAGDMAATMPKLPPSQSTEAQARMAMARRNTRTKGPSYRASAA